MRIRKLQSDMVGAHQNFNGSRDLTTPLLGIVCHPLASTCYDQLTCQIGSLLMPLITKIWKVIQKAKNGVVWG